MFKRMFDRMSTVTPQVNAIPPVQNVTVPAPTTFAPYTTYTNISSGGASVGNAAQAGTINISPAGAVQGSNWSSVFSASFSAPGPSHIVSFLKPSSNREIVKLNLDGSVTWSEEIDIDAAAEAFGKSLQLGAEMKAGITQSVKLKMRDSVFEDLINIAREKGALTAEDLTYLLEASKIVEKLKGGN